MVGNKDNKNLGAYGRDTSENEEQLLSFANNDDLALANTFFSTPKGGVPHTFNGRGKKRIGYMLTYCLILSSHRHGLTHLGLLVVHWRNRQKLHLKGYRFVPHSETRC